MRVLIASKNDGKLEGAKRALSIYFENIEIKGIAISSEVSEMPVEDETYIGAKNRLENLKKYAKENCIEADLYMSIESGITKNYLGWVITNIAMIEDKNGNTSYGTGPQFPVPENMVNDVRYFGLSKVMDDIFGKDEERHNKGGGIQMLTHGEITRIDSSKMAFIMALTKLINGDKWR